MDSTEREALYAVEVLVMNTLQPTNEILNGRETLKILHGIAKIAKYCHTHTHTNTSPKFGNSQET